MIGAGPDVKHKINTTVKGCKDFLAYLESIGFSFAVGGRFPSTRDIFVDHARDLKMNNKGLTHLFAFPLFEKHEKFTILEMHRRDGAVYFEENPQLDTAFALRSHTGGPYLEMLVSCDSASGAVSGWIDLRAKFLMENLEIRKPSERLRKTFKELGRMIRK